MKTKILKSDLLLVKSFLNASYPSFVEELNLDMDVDYLVGLCYRFIKEETLQHNLIDLSEEQVFEIELYLNEKGTSDDEIFYKVMLAIQSVLHKYYNDNGTFKTGDGSLSHGYS